MLTKIFVFISLLSVSFCNFTFLNEKCFSSLSDGTNCDQEIPKEFKNVKLPFPNSAFGTVCCYEDGLECFSNKKGTPFECFPGLPECMNIIRPDFFLYVPENVTNEQTFDFFNLTSKIPTLEINSSKNLFLLIHGFGNEWPRAWIADMKTALLSLVIHCMYFTNFRVRHNKFFQNNNVLVLRWTRGSLSDSSLLNYFKAAANARSVGAAVAKVVRTMVSFKKLELSNYQKSYFP